MEHDEWFFPLVLAVAWTLATTYTLVITSRQPSPVQSRTIVAPAPQPIPVVQAPASPHPAPHPPPAALLRRKAGSTSRNHRAR